MYTENAQTSTSPAPYWAQTFDAFIKELSDMPHKDQVELFKALQKYLVENRKSKQESLEKELEAFAADVKAHAEGTNFIASGL